MRGRIQGCGAGLLLLAAGCTHDSGDENSRGLARFELSLIDPSACPPGTHVIAGTSGPDVLIGTGGADCILGGDGDDRIEGLNGNDFLVGGAGDDVLLGGNGEDRLDGELGNDQLAGGNGADLLSGGDGNDVLLGDRGSDELRGGAGQDVLVGGDAEDSLWGEADNDVLDSGRSPDRVVSGGDGEDACRGEACERASTTVTTCQRDEDCHTSFRCASTGLCVACLGDGECADGNVCTTDFCQPALGCSTPEVPDGTLCLDDTVCDGTETCQVGACTEGLPLACDDGAFCNGRESCDSASGCRPGVAPTTDDGIACTADQCDEAADRVTHVAVHERCDDRLYCNGAEICRPSGGCGAGAPPLLGDGVACSVDICDENLDLVQHTPSDALCGTGYQCLATGCEDIDECAIGRHDCAPDARCIDQSGSYYCNCRAGFEGDGHTCTPVCTDLTVASGQTRCVRSSDDGTVNLRFAATDPVWTKKYTDKDEPVDNYCGPTAMKNLLHWYGADHDSYEVLGVEMLTNTWDTGVLFGLLAAAAPLITIATGVPCLDPICWGVTAGIVGESVIKAGTLPDQMRAALARRAPEGHVGCMKQFDPTFEGIRAALAEGNPILYLESGGVDNLHWATVTGARVVAGELYLRVANGASGSSEVPWVSFLENWSLARVGDPFKRIVLSSLLGLKPFTMLRWVREEAAIPDGLGGFLCP